MPEESADPRWRWHVAAAAAAFWAAMLGTTLPTPLYGLYTARLHLSALQQTTVFATYAGGVLLALVLAGQASDRLGRRPVLLVGVAAAAASAVVFLLPVGLPTLLVGRVLSGLSAGLFTGAATTAIGELAPAASARSASLVATAANILGLGSGPLLAGAVAQAGWAPLRTPYVLHLVLLVGAAAAVARLPETVRDPVEQRPPWRPLRPAVPAAARAAFVPAAVSGFAGFACLGLYSAAEPRVLGELLGVRAPLAAGAVAALIFVASVAGQVATARLPPRRVLPAGCAGLVVGVAVLAGALEASSAGLSLGPSLGLLLLATVVLGASQGACFRAGVAAVGAASPPQRRAEVVSTLFVVFYVAISVPVVGVGALADSAGLRTAVLSLAGLVAVLALVALGLLLARGRRGAGSATA